MSPYGRFGACPLSPRLRLLRIQQGLHAANLLIKQRGALEAEIETAQRADERLAAGDMDGRGVWLRVVEVVWELSIAGPAPAGTVH